MKKYLLLSLWFMGSCSSSSDQRILKTNIKNFMEEPHEIIATQFSEDGLPHTESIALNIEKSETVYLLDSIIYYDDELVKSKLKASKKLYKITEILDTISIKNVFTHYNLIYSGQKKLVVWE